MYIDSGILIQLIIGIIVLICYYRTKAVNYDYVEYGVVEIIKIARRMIYNGVKFHDIVFDPQVRDYFLVLYDNDFYLITIRLYSITDLELDHLYNETNIKKRKKTIMRFILSEASCRIGHSNTSEKIIRYNDDCSEKLEETLKNQIYNKKIDC